MIIKFVSFFRQVNESHPKKERNENQQEILKKLTERRKTNGIEIRPIAFDFANLSYRFWSSRVEVRAARSFCSFSNVLSMCSRASFNSASLARRTSINYEKGVDTCQKKIQRNKSANKIILMKKVEPFQFPNLNRPFQFALSQAPHSHASAVPRMSRPATPSPLSASPAKQLTEKRHIFDVHFFQKDCKTNPIGVK